jgi:predicted Kef-type K+ transport protein
VILPEGVVVVTLVVLAAVVDSSSFEHDVNITATLQIKTIKLIIFFIITSFITEKFRIIPTFMSRVWR